MKMNSMQLLHKDMKKHTVKVTLPGEEEEKEFRLIEIVAKVIMAKDLKVTFGKKVTNIHTKLANKLFGDKEKEFLYGVLVDQEGKMVFSFNRLFADYDGKKKVIAYKDIDDFLMENTPDKKADKIDFLDFKEKKDQITNFPNRRRCTGGKLSYAIPAQS